MQIFERFNPYLTGAVLTGTAVWHAVINLQLFTDSVKEVELFLLNNQMAYKTRERRIRFGGEQRAIPSFSLLGAEAMVDIDVFTTEDMRTAPKNLTEGKLSERANFKQVAALMVSIDKLNPDVSDARPRLPSD